MRDNQIEKIKKRIETLGDEIGDYELDKESLKGDIQDLEGQISDLEGEIDERQDEVDELTAEIGEDDELNHELEAGKNESKSK